MIIATFITCDGCKTVACLKTDLDWNQFDEEWQNGLVAQFCPGCKTSDQAKEARREESAEIAYYARLAASPRTKELCH